LEPDVVEIQLPEEEQHLGVGGVHSEPLASQNLPVVDLYEKFRDQSSARHAAFERVVLGGATLEQ
jgi:hypothetical protein